MDADAARSLLHDRLDRYAVPGAQLGLLNGEERVVVAGGVLQSGTTDPVVPTTPFHVGSIAKSLAALTVVDAASRGEVDLDAPCRDQVPGLWGDTPRALMAQITGRPNELPGLDEDLDAFIARVGEMPLVHPPGRFSYGNAGWSVLDALLRARSGGSFEALAAERVRGRPLTFGQPPDGAVGHVAMPGATPQPVPGDFAAAASAAGSRWWASADELLDYARLHLGSATTETALDPSTDVADLRTPHAPLPGATVADAWGLGWALWDRGPHQAFGWSGFTGGHRAYLRCFPEQAAAVVLLANSAGPLFGPPGGSALFDDLLPAALDLLGVPPLTEPDRPGAGHPTTALVGTYGPVGIEAAGTDQLLVGAAAFGEPAPIAYHRLGADTFVADGEPPGGMPIAIEEGLLYLGPMALPRNPADGS